MLIFIIPFSYCVILRFALAMKTLPSTLQSVLQDVVKIGCHIFANSTTSRLFAAFCGKVGSDSKVLLLRKEVRWLSRGKVLNRLLQLREKAAIVENQQFAKKVNMHNQMKSNDFLQKVAY